MDRAENRLAHPSIRADDLPYPRPVILVSEPEAEAALIVAENRLGWVVKPGASDALAAWLLRRAERAEPAWEVALAIRTQEEFESLVAQARDDARQLRNQNR